jgi:hypothetical protein
MNEPVQVPKKKVDTDCFYPMQAREYLDPNATSCLTIRTFQIQLREHITSTVPTTTLFTPHDITPHLHTTHRNIDPCLALSML